MRIVECDRCHKRIEKGQKIGFVGLDYRDAVTGDLEGSSKLDEWDFCQECMEAIAIFVSAVPAPKEETPKIKPKAEVKRPAEVKPKAEAKPIDGGRIRALAKAGWPAAKIADDIGCSLPTVRKYIKEDPDQKGEES